jgi:hypothetical protein
MLQIKISQCNDKLTKSLGKQHYISKLKTARNSVQQTAISSCGNSMSRCSNHTLTIMYGKQQVASNGVIYLSASLSAAKRRSSSNRPMLAAWRTSPPLLLPDLPGSPQPHTLFFPSRPQLLSQTTLISTSANHLTCTPASSSLLSRDAGGCSKI